MIPRLSRTLHLTYSSPSLFSTVRVYKASPVLLASPFSKSSTQPRRHICHNPKLYLPNMSKHSAACCTIPPVIAENYKEKGSYEEIDGMKTCT
jgi:hypothetical protein